MLRILFILLLSGSLIAGAQDTISVADSPVTTHHQPVQPQQDSIQREINNRSNQQNFNFIQELHRQQTAKKKRQMMIYFGLGIFFLVVLIVGLRRRRKK